MLVLLIRHLIKEFMEDSAEVVCILRPRRFGKSTNLNMLKSFLSTGSDPNRFKEYLIFKEKDFIDQHCGKYPVVFLDLKDIKGYNWDEMLHKICRFVRKLVSSFFTVLNSNMFPSDQLVFDSLTSLTPDTDLVETALSFLIEQLSKICEQRVIVLVDEYDTPLNHAFQNGFYDKASSFFGTFYSSALKGNSALEKACLVGIVQVKGAGILSGLNNFRVYDVAKERYSAFFGFTKEEIECFIPDEETLHQVLNWYNGYWIGSKQMLNPWSFISWVVDRELSSYWVETATVEKNFSTLLQGQKQLFTEIFYIIYNGDPLDVSSLNSAVKYSETEWSIDGILHFLVHAGYLTYHKGLNGMGEVFIPNKELHLHWKVDIFPFIKKKLSSKFSVPLQKAFTAETFEATELQKLMSELIVYPSFHDTAFEISYHNFFYGIFLGVLQDEKSVQVKSNKESGDGRYDVKVEFQNLKRVFIFEFKKSGDEDSLEIDAKKALQQIVDKKYSHGSTNYECHLIGVSFFKKKMSNLEVKTIYP
ncbi:hypothetical protein HK099_008445 [Clydaea vesicula]|uniref:AAA-ATPase-like domain-containing protein n=1 Tax=Clydaea vesicula TaxID=447962 RepID=A0AAD5TXD9_9FUNG|nr:hypothetical protein HK099_008445 [Clydaea vesicula]